MSIAAACRSSSRRRRRPGARGGTDVHVEQATVATIDSVEIAWLVTKRAAAVRSRDAEYLASRYAAGAVTVGVAPLYPACVGDAIDTTWLREWFARFRGRIGHAVRGLTVSVAGDAAMCRSHDRLSARVGVGRRRAIAFATTIGLRRVGGVWLVATEHVELELPE